MHRRWLTLHRAGEEKDTFSFPSPVTFPELTQRFRIRLLTGITATEQTSPVAATGTSSRAESFETKRLMAPVHSTNYRSIIYNDLPEPLSTLP